MQAAWDEEAKANNVYPLDDRQGAARAMGKQISLLPRYVYWGPGISVVQSKAPPINFMSFSLNADIAVPEGGARGVLVATGSQFGGWSFGFDQGRPFVQHNASQKPEDHFRVQADQALPAGPHKLT